MATDANTTQLDSFVFPAWVNKMVLLGLASAGLIGGYVATVGFFATHPKVINVGHMPEQPVPFSHALHAGKLKLDCRYCHNTVDKAAHAAIPPTATCGNCHGGKDRVKEGATLAAVHLKSEKLTKVRESLESEDPVEWIRVHELPGFVYFNHSAHVTRGVGCVECHGRIDKMEVVYQAKQLSMKWCLDCHRNPDEALRPVDQVTNLGWDPKGEELGEVYNEELKKAFAHLGRKVVGDEDDLRLFYHEGKAEAEKAREFGDSPLVDQQNHQHVFAEELFGKDPKLADGDGSGDISLKEALTYLEEYRSTPTRKDLGVLLKNAYKIKPKQNCSTCHR